MKKIKAARLVQITIALIKNGEKKGKFGGIKTDAIIQELQNARKYPELKLAEISKKELMMFTTEMMERSLIKLRKGAQ